MIGENADSKNPIMKRKAYICWEVVAPACANLPWINRVSPRSRWTKSISWRDVREDSPTNLANNDTDSRANFESDHVRRNLHDSKGDGIAH